MTVNEYETLLIERDVAGVLLSPLKYMVREAPGVMRAPGTLPRKARRFLAYEIPTLLREALTGASRKVSAIERMIESLGLQLHFLEEVVDKLAAPQEANWMNLGAAIRLMINGSDEDDTGRLVLGPYQSPILIQWRRAERPVRTVRLRLWRYV